MTLYHPHEQEQVSAIKYALETAPKVQKQLKEKFGYGENVFFDLDLIEYRIHNIRKDIAEDLDVASLYGVSDKVAEGAVSSAFRGYDSEEFLPEYQLEGLFGEQLNDIIEKNRRSITGRIYTHILTQKSAEARGAHIWSLDELLSLHKICEESFGRGREKTSLCMNYVTEKFNERHGTDLTKRALESAYSANKHRLSEAGVDLAEPFWSLDKLVSLNKIRKESFGRGREKTSLCMNYVTEKFNERHGTDLTKQALESAYSRNKHRLSEAGVELAKTFWSLDNLVSLHEIRKKSIGEGFKKTQPCWTYVTKEFNERHGTELTKRALESAYSANKHRLSEEE